MTVIMAVLNVTHDSFSDGGQFLEPEAAIRHGVLLAEQGADIVDVGGESTRPGAPRIPDDLERRRVLPVIRELSARGITVSVDTMNASTAQAAVEAGARYLNDVSGGLADPGLPRVAIDTGLPYIAMHWRGHSADMNSLARYDDAPTDIRRELVARADALLGAGLKPDKLILDPGLGFAKNAEHNWQVLAHLGSFVDYGLPVLIGASRKRFLRSLVTTSMGAEPGTDALDLATAVVSALAVEHGVWGVRVHDVVSTKCALAIAGAWRHGGEA